MFKKLLLGTGVLAALGTGLWATDSGAYIGTAYNYVTSSMDTQMPVQFEIQRARQMISQLEPDIRHNMHAIAESEVSLRQLDEQIAGIQAKVNNQRTAVVKLKTDLEAGKEKYQYNNRIYRASEVKNDLKNRFERLQGQESTLDKMVQIRQAREKSLDAARAKLDGMVAARKQLEVDVANLEAQMELVEAAQTRSSYNFDDSRLAKSKELVQKIQTRLEVASRLVNAQTDAIGSIPVEEEAPADILDQVTKYLDQHNEDQVAQDKLDGNLTVQK